jgi:hypothetical protein
VSNRLGDVALVASCRSSGLGGARRAGRQRIAARRSPAAARFVADSPLEGDGFEPSVPGRETIKPLWERRLLSRKRERICSGTEGSNPSPSSSLLRT